MIRREPEILYEDGEILVCRKEAGLAVQSARAGQMDLESLLKIYLTGKPSGGGSVSRAAGGRAPYLGIIQRLDQPVEGLLVFAKTPGAAAELNRQQQQGRIKKEYLALVEGIPARESGRLEDFLVKDGKTNTSRVVKDGTQGAKRALLEYRVERTVEGEDVSQAESLGTEKKALLRIRLHTGRHHQIRVQLSAMGHPLAGDVKYGGHRAGGGDIGLCAFKIGFFHPKTGKWMEFQNLPKGEIFRESCKNLPV